MINKYAEIQYRIILYNACKGVLRVKQATTSSMGKPSLLLSPLGMGSTLDLRRQYPRISSYTNNNAPNTTTKTKITPSMSESTQYVPDRTNDTTNSNNKSELSDFARRHILRSSTLGAGLGGTL